MSKVWKICAIALVTSVFAVMPALAVDPPKIALERVEVASIQPFFISPKIAVPTKDDPTKTEDKVMAAGYTATLNTAYILKITNSNKVPIMLDELTFTIAFDGFDVNTVTAYEDMWIPAGKTNFLRVVATNEANPTIGSLSVGSEWVERAAKMGKKAPELVKKWFDAISDFDFPVEVKDGSAVFKTEDGKELRTNFSGKFGKAAEKK
ncbi:MAG: hypothetical protein FJ118_06850 [Deltaproteobacteria bacterium]|nr:hypothetical protein [Deltaproteobacteria bacterium]